MGRTIDSEALRAYRETVQAQLDTLEQDLIPQLENGNDLGKMPAFGQLDTSESARTNYTTFHETTWNNLQLLREAMHGIITTLNDSGELSDESDETTAAEMDNTGGAE